MIPPDSPASADISILIPASNEAEWIGPCLDALLAQTKGAGSMLVIVSTNACHDDTAARALTRAEAFAARGSRLTVIDSTLPGKPGALNRAEVMADPGPRVYLDADVICTADLIAQIRRALASHDPCYATGRLAIAPAKSALTRRYAELWRRLPFLRAGATGAGFFAVNAEGRARWKAFPDVISDDTFVRLHFAPAERVEVTAGYIWPLPEGFANLVRVRRRQEDGVAELRRLMPDIFANDETPILSPSQLFVLMARRPLDLAAYLAVRLAARLRPAAKEWSRGR